jgi:hypothetical protein
MPKKAAAPPTVTYKQVENPDPAAIDAVFDYIFELLLKNKAKKEGPPFKK